jgi:hypothetical protein
MFATAAKNAMLDAEPTTHLSLHTAWSATGANEVSGGSPAYARQAATWDAASGAVAALSAPVTFDVPAATTVKWVGRWTADTGGTFLGMSALNGAETEFSVDLTADTIKQVAHGYANGTRVVFVGGTPPGGLTEGTEYFVVSAATDTYQVAATAGGAAIDLTAEPAAACVASKVIPETYGAQGTLQVTTLPLALTH